MMTTDKPEDGWHWWAGTDEYMTVGPCATRQEAVDQAVEEEIGADQDDNGRWYCDFVVMEARQDPLRLADWLEETDVLLERADESVANSDRASEFDDEFFPTTPEQESDLGERLRRACDEWQAAHGLVFKTRTFIASRNEEDVRIDVSDPKEAA